MPQVPRRKFLRRTGIAATTGLIAGCTGPGEEKAAETTTTTTEGSTTQTTEETTTTTALPEHAIWQFTTDADLAFGPAVADGALFVGDANGRLYALDPESGEKRWTFGTEGSFADTSGTDFSPIVADGVVYVTSGNQSGAHGAKFAVYALDATTGKKRWSFDVEYPKFLSLLGVADGNVYAATSDDVLMERDETLYALDANSGEQQWTGQIGDPSDAVTGAGGVYVESRAGVRGFAATDGSTRWTRNPQDAIGVEADSQNVYVGVSEPNPKVDALDPVSGEGRWSISGWEVTSLRAADHLYVGGEHAVSYTADGTERWRYDEGGLVLPTPVVGGRVLLAASRGLIALSTDDGSEEWVHQTEPGYGPAVSEQVVAFQPRDTEIVEILDAASGDRRFRFETGTRRFPDPAVWGDTAYVGVGDSVYALRG